MKTRKHGGVLGMGEKSEDNNFSNCRVFFRTDGLFNKRMRAWNKFLENNPGTGGVKMPDEYINDDQDVSYEANQWLNKNYDNICNKEVVNKIRFPGLAREFLGFGSSLSLANGKIVPTRGGKRKSYRKRTRRVK
jgi:hypothetical protein